jgi:16S rRNA (guanine527-N7)-methyltransferase
MAEHREDRPLRPDPDITPKLVQGLAERGLAIDEEQLAQLLEDLSRAAQIGRPLGARQRAQILAYVALLEKWNRTYNLTAIRAPAQMVTHHVLDALAVLPHLPRTDALRVLDVGSGGGVPGIPLAIARAGWSVVVLDSNQKKGAFLQQAAIELCLANVQVVTSRVEDYVPAMPFDVVISRAFSDLATFARGASRLLARDGRLYAMKGAYPRDEIARLPASIRVVAAPALDVPGLDAARHLVVMEPA